MSKLIANKYSDYKALCNARFAQLKANEEELNRNFIEIYGLQDELTPDVSDIDVTVHYICDTKGDIPDSFKRVSKKTDKDGKEKETVTISSYVRTKRDEIVSLISYAVGCMFGRYSLDMDGLVYAGGNFSDVYLEDALYPSDTLFPSDKLYPKKPKYTQLKTQSGTIALSFSPVYDNIIPICDDDYFNSDITGQFVQWVETVYGKGTLEENLKFIADALGGKGSPREVIRKYFLNGFFSDHCKTYQKRPIYWLFDSGKQNGFKALIYMHRYQPDTIARIRTDYVHEQQARYRTAIADLEQRINGVSTSERVKLNKQLAKLQAQAAEIREYEEKIHHLADQMIQIDLDDGVKHNYEIFKDVLANLK